MNRIYHFIDRFVSKNSDQVWNVSTRIASLRKKQGIPDKKNYFVPNSPPFNKDLIKDTKNINNHEIVTVGTTSSSINFELLIQVIRNLKPKYPDLLLNN